jgi:hypothetical protein
MNDGFGPENGVWGGQPTRIQVISVIAAHCLLLVVLALQGKTSLLWHTAGISLGGLAVTLPAVFLKRHLNNKGAFAPNGSIFAMWALSSAVLGIPAGHFTLFLLAKIHPIDNEPYSLAYFPEVSMVLIMGYAYWRFMYVRQWQYKLDTEKLTREAAEHGQALALAQLKMLQAQIEPHFLFNTLASVQHLVRKDPQLADYLLSQLVTYLREAMPDIRGMGSTLGREFGLVGAYLNIAKVRMGGRLEIEVNIPPELTGLAFPSLVTQTLVENALKHGVEPKQGPVKISVSAAQVIDGANCFVEIQVVDNGVGFGVSQILGTGIGLRNVRERLAGLYGGSARLTVSDTSPSGVNATIRIPK